MIKVIQYIQLICSKSGSYNLITNLPFVERKIPFEKELWNIENCFTVAEKVKLPKYLFH